MPLVIAASRPHLPLPSRFHPPPLLAYGTFLRRDSNHRALSTKPFGPLSLQDISPVMLWQSISCIERRKPGQRSLVEEQSLLAISLTFISYRLSSSAIPVIHSLGHSSCGTLVIIATVWSTCTYTSMDFAARVARQSSNDTGGTICHIKATIFCNKFRIPVFCKWSFLLACTDAY